MYVLTPPSSSSVIKISLPFKFLFEITSNLIKSTKVKNLSMGFILKGKICEETNCLLKFDKLLARMPLITLM